MRPIRSFLGSTNHPIFITQIDIAIGRSLEITYFILKTHIEIVFEYNKIIAKEIVAQMKVERPSHEKCFIHRNKHFL